MLPKRLTFGSPCTTVYTMTRDDPIRSDSSGTCADHLIAEFFPCPPLTSCTGAQLSRVPDVRIIPNELPSRNQTVAAALSGVTISESWRGLKATNCIMRPVLQTNLLSIYIRGCKRANLENSWQSYADRFEKPSEVLIYK